MASNKAVHHQHAEVVDMAYTGARALHESALARAHRAICQAEEAAYDMGSDGAAYDCHLIAQEILRLAQDSLKDRNRRAPSGDNDRTYL